MSVVTIARYRAITGDTTTPSVTCSARLEEAEDLCAAALGRQSLEEGEHTETLTPTRDGYIWPVHTPITDAGDYTINGHGLIGPFGTAWSLVDPAVVTVTYTGGWVERSENPTATNRLPAYIEADICRAAQTLGVSPVSDYPVGATSVRLGDAAVSFGSDGPPRGGVAGVQWSRRTLSHRSSVVRGVGSFATGGYVGVGPWY